MQAPIVPVGLTTSYALPGLFLEINFAQGPALGTGLQRPVLVLANKTSAGTATTDTEIYGPATLNQLASEPQMLTLGGSGSEAHRMFRRMANVAGGADRLPPVYWLFVAESGGTAATGTVVIANAATANGVHNLWIADELVQTSIAKDDTAIDIATNIVAAVSAKVWLPVTASNAGGTSPTVTLTAKQKGNRGTQIRYMAAILSDGTITTTTTATTETSLSVSTTDDTNAAALATILPRGFNYIVSAANDLTNLGALVSQVNTQAGAMIGLRETVLAGHTGTAAAAISLASNSAINAARAELIWSEKNPWTAAELAANNAVVYAMEEADDIAYRQNFIGYGNDAETQPFWKVPAPRLASAWPTQSSLNTLLANGVSPIGVNPNGSTYLVDRFTTRSLNGGQPELRIRDAHKRVTPDRIADVFLSDLRAAGAGKVLLPDPPDGRSLPPNAISPRIIRMIFFSVLDRFNAAGHLKNLDDIKRGTRVQLSATPGRAELRSPLQPSDNFRQGAFIFDQVA